ncbi:MAG: trypsin-like peptidase domain-containing protein [Candidatus Acidiferrales bacterium]
MMATLRPVTLFSRTVLLLLFCASAVKAQRDLSASAIFKAAKPSIVLIIGGDSKGQPTVQGSGFIIAPNRIVTNHHVVAGTSAAMVVFSDGATAAVTDVVADSPAKDLIVLGAKTGQRPALNLGDEMTLQQGDPVYAIGAPQGLELTLTNGIVSAFRSIDNRFLIQATASIGHGSSGGPLLNHEGRVVGITSGMLSNTPGVYFSVGVGDLRRMLRTPPGVLLSFADWASQNPAAAGGSAPSSEASSASSGTNEIDTIEGLLQDEKFDQARTAIDAWAVQHPDDQITQRLNGELDVRTGDVPDALKQLQGYVQSNPTDPLGQFYYALALYQGRGFTDALQHEQESNRLEPTAADQPLLALLYYSVRDYRQAEDAARRALASDHANTTALEVLAGVAYHGASSGQDTWGEYVSQLSTLKPDDFWVHLSRALDAYNQNQAETAVNEFKAAEQSDFPDAAPFYILGRWYDRSSQLGAANDQITAGLTSLPDDPELLDEGMYISLKSHDYTQAGRRFASLEGDYPDVLLTEGAGCLYYYGIGQPTQALPYCARNVNLSANEHTAYSNYGWAALDANQFQLALQEFSQAYKIASPNWAKMNKVETVDLLWGFTIADYNTGNKKGAHKLLKVLRQYPDAVTITGLQQMPLLWSETTMSRIEAILTRFPK